MSGRTHHRAAPTDRSPTSQSAALESSVYTRMESDRQLIPITIKLRRLRFAIVSVIFCALSAFLLVLFYESVVLHSFLASSKSADEQAVLLDNYNSYAAIVTSALASPVNWYTTLVLPVTFLSLAPASVMQVKPSVVTMIVTMGFSFGINYFLTNSFGGLYVQFSAVTVVPYITANDLALGAESLDSVMADATDVTNLISELSKNNSIANTALRNVITPIDFDWSAFCTSDTSSEAAQVVQSYGFPMNSWQSRMLSSAIDADSYTVSLRGDSDDHDFSSARLPMNASLAANVFVNAVHMSRYFFRWFDSSSLPFNMTGLIKASYQPDKASTIHSVAASSLLKLLPTEPQSEQAQTEYFLAAAFSQYKNSLNGATNISRTESNMTFSHVDISDGISFDAVTLEIPLIKSFYYRKLIQEAGASALSEDTSTSASNNSGINYYDLDLTTDCGPNAGLCVMPDVQEYDVDGNEYQPEPQVKAIAVCLNDDGTEDFQIDYEYYSTNGATKTNVYWACPNQSRNSMWIVSLAVRIIGDALYDSAAPDATTTTLENHRATIENPRKVYALTVGRLHWESIDLATEYSAECSEGEAKCFGLRYILESSNSTEQHLILGNSNTPVEQLNPYAYNSTETSTTTTTRWVPLLTLATLPSTHNERLVKGDLLMSYNFESYNWSSTTRTEAQCSAAAEDYLNRVVENHYYLQSGLQPAYTSAMFFLFKSGVVKDTVVTDTNALSLAFDGNEQWIDLTIGIPPISFLISLAGVGVLFIMSLVVLVQSCSREYTQNGLRHPQDLTAEMVAQMMFDDVKYPPLFLERNLKNGNAADKSDSIEAFKIDALTVRHAEKGDTFALPVGEPKVLDAAIAGKGGQDNIHLQDDSNLRHV